MASGTSTPLTSILATDENSIYIPLAQINDDEFSSIRLRTMQQLWPTMVYDSGDYPLRTLSFWPVPQQVNIAELWLWEPLNVYVDLDEELNLPQGYERYLRFALAVEIAAEFGKEVSPAVTAVLREAESNLKRLNQKVPIAKTSNALNNLTARNRGWTYLTMIQGNALPRRIG